MRVEFIMHKSVFFIVLLMTTLFSSFSMAHQSSHSQINLQQEGPILTGSWHIAIDDLERSEGLDTNADGNLTWGEVIQQKSRIDAIAQAHFRIQQGEVACELHIGDLALDKLTTGLYLYLPVDIQCPAEIRRLRFDYDFLFSFDAQHKSILTISSDAFDQSVIFREDKKQFFYDALSNNKTQTVLDFIVQGAWHIWIGFDHILFLLSLLLPAALVLNSQGWCDRQAMKLTLVNTTKIVTAFTLAHSLTLALSLFDWISLSSQLVESVIALSVIVAALNNIKPLVHQRLWLLTFGFGLIHGLGFASVLNDVGLPAGLEGLALFGFNVGVELGQLAIVVGVLPLIYWLSQWRAYRTVILPIGSLMIAGMAVVWLIERMT